MAGQAAGRGAGDGPSTRLVIANALLFQVAWFACVLGAARGNGWIGPAAVGALFAWHLCVVARPLRELQLAAWVLLIGAGFNALWLASGAIVFAAGGGVPLVGPAWLLALWLLFALTLNVSLRWLHGRPWLAVLLGAITGPLSFWGGVRLGAASFSRPVFALALLAACWAIALPWLVWLATRHDGVAAAPKSTRSTPAAPQEAA